MKELQLVFQCDGDSVITKPFPRNNDKKDGTGVKLFKPESLSAIKNLMHVGVCLTFHQVQGQIEMKDYMNI